MEEERYLPHFLGLQLSGRSGLPYRFVLVGKVGHTDALPLLEIEGLGYILLNKILHLN